MTLLIDIENHLSERKSFCYKRPEIDFFMTDEINHDRHEIRRFWVCPITNKITESACWVGLSVIVRVESVRTYKGETSIEKKYYITSKRLKVEEALGASRSHWAVESMHWMLDVGFNEDNNRTRTGYSAENLAVVCQITLNVLRQDKITKLGIKNKRLKVAVNQGYSERMMPVFEPIFMRLT